MAMNCAAWPLDMASAATPVLERGHALFQHRRRRVHDPRVDVAELLQGEQRRGVVGVVEGERGRLINGHGAGVRRRVRLIAGVQGAGVESEMSFWGVCHRCFTMVAALVAESQMQWAGQSSTASRYPAAWFVQQTGTAGPSPYRERTGNIRLAPMRKLPIVLAAVLLMTAMPQPAAVSRPAVGAVPLDHVGTAASAGVDRLSVFGGCGRGRIGGRTLPKRRRDPEAANHYSDIQVNALEVGQPEGRHLGLRLLSQRRQNLLDFSEGPSRQR